MKILFIATVDLHIQTFHLRTIHQLHARGDIVDVCTNGTYTNEDIHHKYTLPFSRNPLSLSNLKAKKELRKILIQEKYDILSCHTPLAAYFARMAAKGLNIKVIYTAHGFHFYKGAPLVNTLIYKTMEKRAAKYTDTLVTINPEDYEAAKKFTYKSNGGPIYIPGVGIDVKKIQSLKCDKSLIRKELNIPEDAFVLYSIGELNENKNHQFVIDTLKDELLNNPNFYYVVAGRGKLEDYYKEYLEKEHLTNKVLFLGFRTDARRLLYCADVFVFPSKREGLPVSVIEAMSAGLPIVATDIRGNHDLIKDGINGYLYPVDNKDIFKQRISALHNDKELRDKLGQEAYKNADEYSIERVDPMIMGLYKINE